MPRRLPARRLPGAAFLVALAVPFALASSALAQQQTRDQQGCLATTAKGTASIFKAQGKQNASCLKTAGKGGDLPGGSAQGCLTADPKEKVGITVSKVLAAQGKSCTTLPSFGYGDTVTIRDAAKAASLAIVSDLFGNDLGAAAASCKPDNTACTCQAAVLKTAQALASVELKTFQACQKESLAGGADSASALAACVGDVMTASSTTLKVEVARDKLRGAVLDDCITPAADTATLLGGECSGVSGDPALAECIGDRVDCRTCEMLRDAGSLPADCDLFDDGVANASCVSFPGYALFSVSAALYVRADAMTGLLSAIDTYPASAYDYVAIDTTMGGQTFLRATATDHYYREDGTTQDVYADAADQGSATPWVVFAVTGSDPLTVIILKDGSAGINVDVLAWDSGSGHLKVVTTDISSAFSNPAFSFQLVTP